MTCQDCSEDVEEIVRVKVGKKTLKLCEDCASKRQEEEEMGEEAESAMQGMMEYKGRR